MERQRIEMSGSVEEKLAMQAVSWLSPVGYLQVARAPSQGEKLAMHAERVRASVRTRVRLGRATPRDAGGRRGRGPLQGDTQLTPMGHLVITPSQVEKARQARAQQ